jgi:hypothetical protein
MRAEFISARMSYIILRGRHYDINVLNVHAPTEDKTDSVKTTFCKELERVFNKFPKYQTKIANCESTHGSLHEISNDNRVTVLNFATSKNLTAKSTMFPYRNIHKYTWMSPDGKLHTQIDHILIDRQRHFNVLDVRTFRAADCDSDHYLVVEKVRERLEVSKQR